jgi:hypothetical protein
MRGLHIIAMKDSDGEIHPPTDEDKYRIEAEKDACGQA